jgi:hypothetical protein
MLVDADAVQLLSFRFLLFYFTHIHLIFLYSYYTTILYYFTILLDCYPTIPPQV